MEYYRPRVQRDLGCNTLTPRVSNRQSADGVGVFTPWGAVFARGLTVFVPGLLDW